ncbi:MAG TPA: hypothetical protein DF383_09135 [Deltaproteobacteria bacterium]|nr:hypothetical protein [Deltaproteobacteria bacterium]
MVQIPMPRMTEKELAEILTNAEKLINVSFSPEARIQVIRMSQGLPHFTHLIGLNAVRAAAGRRNRQVIGIDVQAAFSDAVAQSDQAVASAYSNAIHSAQPGAKYPQVLLAAAIAAFIDADDYGYFQPSNLVGPMTIILGRQEEISGFNQHLSQFTEAKRGRVLERAGHPRSYRFRFAHPLLPPYVIMRSIRDKIVITEQVNKMLEIEL